MKLLTTIIVVIITCNKISKFLLLKHIYNNSKCNKVTRQQGELTAF